MRGLTPVTADEFDAIAAAFAGETALRDRTLWILGCCTGYRIAELLSLRVSDVWISGRVVDRVEVSARFCKRRKRSRTVAVNEQAREALAMWLSHLRRRPGFEPSRTLWPGRRTAWRPITNHSFRWALKQASRRAGVNRRVSTHTMRKTFAAGVWLATEKDIRQTQMALGHESISSTACYLSSCDDAVETAVRSLHFGRHGGSPHAEEQLFLNVVAFSDAS